MSTRTYDRLILESGKTYTQPAGDIINVLNYTNGDWDGAIFASGTPGSPFYLNVPIAGIAVVGCQFTDCHAAGGGVIDATDGGIDGGGNDANILFSTTTTIIRRTAIAIKNTVSTASFWP